MEKCDILIIGAGPGGLAAAVGARKAGAGRVVILERDVSAGGILNQCVHDGFGLIRYNEQLTGPEYAVRAVDEALKAGAEILCGHQVIRISEDKTVVAASRYGLKRFSAGAIILATGCRERTRGAISIPGSRPAGVFTAGVIQNFVNVRNIMPGRRVVILGSGDIGMIMARRLTLEGAEIRAVVEVLPEPAGLSRNVSQCIYDYGIPLHCSHTVSRIIGKKKLEAVEISEVDENMHPIQGTEQIIECDALVLSVGLIPENEVAEIAGVRIDTRSNGTVTDEFLQTSVPGIFSCGNSHRVMDLADFVSQQGELVGYNAVAYINGSDMKPWEESRGTSMAKGFPEPDTVTCTLCPNGCQIRFDGEKYEGNRCPRGVKFAEEERISPKRMVTTTVKTEDGRLLPVRTDRAVPKGSVRDVIKSLNKMIVRTPVKCGDIILRFTDASGETAAVIASSDMYQLLPM